MTEITLAAIRKACSDLEGRIVATPTVGLTSDRIAGHLPQGARLTMKLELFQQAGSFKSRGVLLAIDAMNTAEREAGVTAVSAGNHALAVSWGAMKAGISAKVVMPRTADNIRVQGCRDLGAEVILSENVGEAFREVAKLRDEEGRTMLHPFESPFMSLGAATCGYEFASAHPDLEVVLVPVGGGGLISGMSSAIKLLLPDCQVLGVEPFGADSMYRSFQAGEPVQLEAVNTIADSLGAPMALPQSFAMTRAHVDEIIRIDDEAMRKTMGLLYDALKIVAEPACAASTAAALGPLKDRLAGKRVGVIACGSNISRAKFSRILDGEG